MTGLVSLYKGLTPYPRASKKGHTNRARRQVSESQEESLHQNLTMLAPNLGLQLPELRENKFLLFKPPSPWYFLMAA